MTSHTLNIFLGDKCVGACMSTPNARHSSSSLDKQTPAGRNNGTYQTSVRAQEEGRRRDESRELNGHKHCVFDYIHPKTEWLEGGVDFR